MVNEASKARMVLPDGTQMVIRAAGRAAYGTVGEVIEVPGIGDDRYLVRLPDGETLPVARHELAIRKEVQRLLRDSAAVSEAALYDYVIYRCVVGSRAYGLDEGWF